MRQLLGRILRRPLPPVALLTDFGPRDHYVGTMKGVIASINPRLRVIDLCHEPSPHNVTEAAYLLWSAYKYFPRDTVFVVVVDPGVGSTRRILLLRISERWFLVPDNGVIDFVLAEQRQASTTVMRISGSPYVLSAVSDTFHGRDVFAPLAAYVSLGVAPEELGEPSPAPVPANVFVHDASAKTALVLHVDHFGNIVTNIRSQAGFTPAEVAFRGRRVRKWVRTYSEAPQNVPCMLTGSNGLVEIAVRNASAATLLRAKAGLKVGVSWK